MAMELMMATEIEFEIESVNSSVRSFDSSSDRSSAKNKRDCKNQKKRSEEVEYDEEEDEEEEEKYDDDYEEELKGNTNDDDGESTENSIEEHISELNKSDNENENYNENDNIDINNDKTVFNADDDENPIEDYNYEFEDDLSGITNDLTDDDEHLFHFEFMSESIQDIPVMPKKYKNGTRKSLTFSNERMREIERHNRILLKKILDKGPVSNQISRKTSASSVASNKSSRVSSAAINRKKQQRQIDLDNQVLKRKIETIHRKRIAYI